MKIVNTNCIMVKSLRLNVKRGLITIVKLFILIVNTEKCYVMIIMVKSFILMNIVTFKEGVLIL